MNEKPVEEAATVADSPSSAPPDSSGKAGFTYAYAKDSARQAVDAVVAGGKVAGEKLAEAARATGKGVKEATVVIGDLNKDGKVDREDANIAAAKAKSGTAKFLREAGKITRGILKHPMFKDAAAGAAIGALVAIPIPIIGPAGGAAAGAIVGVFKNITSRKR